MPDCNDGRVELESYTFVLLRRGPRAAEYTEEELDRLQEEHLAYLDSMRASGDMLVAGPFSDQEDETLRGFCIFRTSLDRTRELTARDPSVQAGRMQADVMTWSTLPGSVSFG